MLRTPSSNDFLRGGGGQFHGEEIHKQLLDMTAGWHLCDQRLYVS